MDVEFLNHFRFADGIVTITRPTYTGENRWHHLRNIKNICISRMLDVTNLNYHFSDPGKTFQTSFKFNSEVH